MTIKIHASIGTLSHSRTSENRKSAIPNKPFAPSTDQLTPATDETPELADAIRLAARLEANNKPDTNSLDLQTSATNPETAGHAANNITSADIALATAERSHNTILQKPEMAMQAQATIARGVVLSLLKN